MNCSANAVLEVNGRAPFRTPSHHKSMDQFDVSKYVIMSTKGVSMQNLVGINSAVTMPQLREMCFCVEFLLINVKNSTLKHDVRIQVTCLKQQKSFCNLIHGYHFE